MLNVVSSTRAIWMNRVRSIRHPGKDFRCAPPSQARKSPGPLTS